MSQPPDYPGRDRVKRAAGSLAGDAYQGAFEAVMAVLVGAGAGYWVDGRWQTTPYGVITGLVLGFAAMVLRLLRLGRELPPPEAGTQPGAPDADRGPGSSADRDGDLGPAESPGLSDVWRDAERDDGNE